jgi:hypothetical protein
MVTVIVATMCNETKKLFVKNLLKLFASWGATNSNNIIKNNSSTEVLILFLSILIIEVPYHKDNFTFSLCKSIHHE